jgi:YHS domain-containing protein
MMTRDPVCGMEIRWEEAVGYAVLGPVVVYFCCGGCATRFRQDPTRHVDVEAWLSDDNPATEGDGCDARPLPFQRESRAHRSLQRSAVPRLGRLTLDELEDLVQLHWRRRLGAGEPGALRTRVLERCLLLRAATGAIESRDPESDRFLAAEVARLRDRRHERRRIALELDALPAAFAAALLEAEMEGAEVARIRAVLEADLAEAVSWTFGRPDALGDVQGHQAPAAAAEET